MNCAVEMGSDAVMCILSFIKTGSGIQELIWWIHRQHEDHISLHSFFQNKESRLKNSRKCIKGKMNLCLRSMHYRSRH
jgi:hypothetical protein